ncbi:hypothetical protein AVEN_230917-1 [Araneus ventricosus]|uniref:Uncharacterized protein n=1 Tax=Araneus ventricosus TaxID=182803 RepID=A0A4Y2A378_ARAVE|nr:hypothetical protein AVEN_230917-1 [Araneus ventricosus]
MGKARREDRRGIVQETAVDKVELSSERDKLSSLRASEVNKPPSCKVGSVGASSNALKSALVLLPHAFFASTNLFPSVGLFRKESSSGRRGALTCSFSRTEAKFLRPTLRLETENGVEKKGNCTKEFNDQSREIPG